MFFLTIKIIADHDKRKTFGKYKINKNQKNTKKIIYAVLS